MGFWNSINEIFKWKKLNMKENFKTKYKRAVKEAQKFNESLTSEDCNLHITIRHEDQSFFDLYYASYKEFDIFIIVITEHNGNLIFTKFDIELMKVEDMYKEQRRENRKIIIDNRDHVNHNFDTPDSK